ncbi:hypothetical protein GGI13_007091 [Coemansia sp. RSA 455]|nr:hypothetical protein GGI14_005199 [Coemansia sp. S680]KAJ2037054.1 hypothetical protein H4S03_003233 [Coemansia sp. S3946]KAJ2051321.1 hypothetical protein H4S04_002048 [Coemansia sp. S16]KAJ2065413.1 hypothetical protein GGH13_005999 [Coemansia sp. S155-1]KAJ2102760.1 hypothetical protein GGI09_001044 [Coemansia sp. S100]KAJ2113476.1 hypothetical protein IW146_003827 [Coemansia sp. RSA 922]KAJ2242076.1 hypothetical protein GGI13_007091 [Coemansia sp. RSA 455]KAJ2353181.1 hypothetical pro
MFRNAIARTVATQRLSQATQSRHLASSVMYVRNLPLNTTESELADRLSKYGPVYEYQFTPKRPGDEYAIAFVKFYSGDLPSTIEELASLPAPIEAEVEDVVKRCSEAIASLDGSVFNGRSLNANFARKNQPDAIQFNARMAVRKANDPMFAARMEDRKNQAREQGGSSSGSNQYSAGYKDGFKDGLQQGQQNAGRN